MKSRLSHSTLLKDLLRPALTLALTLVLVADALPQVSETFNSSGTFAVPSGVTEVTVECWGGGGRGGTRSSNGRGGGGGGGAYSRSVLTVTPSTNYTVTVGDGSNSTAAGGDSWFGNASTILAKGGASCGNNSENGAVGGSQAASIGTVKFGGGDGANAPGSSGGGGGSSAGSAQAGVDATNINGATAPTGGGSGGNGRNGNDNGYGGSNPGGGGGGAERTSGTRNGGNGGNGQVIISYNIEGVCMSAASYNAIPDNNTYISFGIPISGLPTALGVGSGNVRLESVEFIISHTTNNQLDITLTSPSNVTRTLSMDRFGSGDNYGNPSSCPGSAFVMRDGGAALTNTNTNNPTGPYAPTESLDGFTGDPNGVWNFNIRDDQNGTSGNLRYLKLNFCVLPEITSATSNSPICGSASLSLVAVANNATSYSWAGTGTFSPNATSASVTVAGAASGTYTVTATNTCGSVDAGVAVVANPGPQNVTASSSSSSVCSNANTVDLTSSADPIAFTVLSQDFNSGISPWTTTNTSTGSTPANAAWTARADGYQFNAYSGLVTFNSNDASQFVLSNSDAQGGGTTATTIVSPVFSTVGFTSLSLSYYHYYRYNSGNDDRARVEVSTNGSSWTTVETHSSIQGAPSGFVQSTINLSSYVNEANLQIRFRYNASWDYFWALDNVVITGSPAVLTYAWTSAPSGFSSALQNPTGVAVTQSTVYTVTVTGPNGCTASADASVTYTPAPSATISYAGSPYCTAAGNASVTRTGTAGGTYTAAPAGLSINSSSGLVTLGSSTPGPYTVTYTVAAAGGCALFTTTASITVNASATIYADTDGDGFGDPSDFTTGCLPVAGYVANNTDNCPTLFGLIGDACDDSNANTINDMINGSCVCIGTVAVYYSQSSGNVTDNIWDAVPVGTGGPANFTSASNMVIQSGHVVTNTADVDLKDLDVQAGGELVLNTGVSLNVNGTTADLDGTITAAYGSTLALLSTSATALSTTGTPVLSDLLVSTASGTTLSGNLDLIGTLGLVDGTFDATGGTVRLLSDATNTGNLGQVGATANYAGNMTVQRYIPAGATNWRLLGSPVNGTGVSDWNADFFTAGFPGSNYPTFDSPVGSNILWPSIREYDETATGIANDGLIGVASTATLLDAGKGFAAWCGDNFATTTAFTVDVTGPPNIANSPIDLEVSYTAGSGSTEDGWNLVSNPLPSVIDFTSVTLGANTFDGYYVYNPIDGSTEIWDEVLQTSSGSHLNGEIASSQGFWLKTTAADPTNSSVAETAKIAGNGGPLFGGLQVPAFPIIRLNISSNVNSFSDNALVVFDLGAPAFEPIDAPKMFFSDSSAPMIASLASTGESMAINKYGAITEGLSIPVKVQSYVAGTFTITAGISGNPFACMWLEDTQTGTLTALTDGAQYSFQLAAGASTTARFLIHSTAAIPLTLEPGLCGANGAATVDLGNNVADITWTTPTGTVVLEQLGASGENTFSTPDAGNYTVHISTNAVCGELVQDLYIDIDATAVIAEFTAPATSVVNEAVAFTNTSTEYGTFFWNFGDNTTSTEVNPTHVYAEPGTYTVTLEVTADDCVVTTTHDVVVSVSTGITTFTSTDLNVWSNEQGIVVEHGFTEGIVKVEVVDATGSLHIQRQVAAAPGRIVLATDALNTGIWFVRVTNGERVQSFRVPLVR